MGRFFLFFFLFSLLNWNSSFLQRISAIRHPFEEPDAPQGRPHNVIFHASTGLCVLRESMSEPLKLGPCTDSEAWSYTPQKILKLKGTYFCLQAVGLEKPAKLTAICNTPGTNWESISDSGTYLSTNLEDGTTVCLDADSSNDIVTNACKCLSSRDDTCDPGTQGFKIANSTDISSKPILGIGFHISTVDYT